MHPPVFPKGPAPASMTARYVGPGRDGRLAIAYKLPASAQERWRPFNGHALVADVLNGVKFKDGIKVTDDNTATQDEKVAA
jgi:hypothetical protein